MRVIEGTVHELAEVEADYAYRLIEEQTIYKAMVETFGVAYPEPEKLRYVQNTIVCKRGEINDYYENLKGSGYYGNGANRDRGSQGHNPIYPFKR